MFLSRQRRRPVDRLQDVFRQIRRSDRAGLIGDDIHGILYSVLKFPDIARPVIELEQFQGSRIQRCHIFQQKLAFRCDKNSGKQDDVLFPFPQRRDRQIDDAQPVVKVFPQKILLDGICGQNIDIGDHTDIQIDQLGSAYPAEISLLQYAQQLGLQGDVHGIDLIQQQRSAVGLFK